MKVCGIIVVEAVGCSYFLILVLELGQIIFFVYPGLSFFVFGSLGFAGLIGC